MAVFERKAVAYTRDGQRRDLGTVVVDTDNPPENPTLAQWIAYGFSGMTIDQWLTWGRPYRCNPIFSLGGLNKTCLKPPGGTKCSASQEQKYRDQPEVLAQWFEMAPGCRGGFEATSGLQFSESAGGFIGTPETIQAPDARTIETVQAPPPVLPPNSGRVTEPETGGADTTGPNMGVDNMTRVGPLISEMVNPDNFQGPLTTAGEQRQPAHAGIISDVQFGTRQIVGIPIWIIAVAATAWLLWRKG